MRAKNGEILARIGEEMINSTSRESLDFTRIFSDLEQKDMQNKMTLALRQNTLKAYANKKGVPVINLCLLFQ